MDETNGTIKRWEQQSPRLDGLKKVADYLHISIDYLVYGDSETWTSRNGDHRLNLDRIKRAQGLMCDGNPLTDNETDLVAMFRSIDERDRKTIFDLTMLKYQQLAEAEPLRIPFAAHGWADITPEADSMIQEKLRQFEKKSLELKGKK